MVRSSAAVVVLLLHSFFPQLVVSFRGPNAIILRYRNSALIKKTRDRSVVVSQALETEFSPSTTLSSDAIADDCDISQPLNCASEMPSWILRLAELQEKGLGSVVLMMATLVSLGLANSPATSATWLSFWSKEIGPKIGGHALSAQGWVNEGLMAVFFFVVGLEIKLELRQGSLSSVKKALLPCVAALGGMVTPILIYFLTTVLMGGGSLAALTVPMATDIAFAMAIFGFFRSKMPPSASVFLLTLATVDDLGAILVLATCFASHIAPAFLGAAAALTAGLGVAGARQITDARVFAAGGAALWWCLLRAGVSADIAGVLVALCISTRAMVDANGQPELINERLITRLSPLATFIIMPLFALANTAVPLRGVLAAGTGEAARYASVAPAAGIATGLLLGKPLGIFGATKLATKFGLAQLPNGMTNKHLGVVSVLGGIGFTMCLLLTEVAMPAALQPIPKLSVLVSSAIASIVGATAMWKMRPWNAASTTPLK